MQKKILFINAIKQDVEVEQRYPSLGLGYLASSLRQNFGGDVFDFKIVDRGIEETLSDFKPNLVGISAVSQNFNLAKKYAELAKKEGIPVIVGGIHISTLPDSLSCDMNVGCLGEGETTIIELMKIFLREDGFPANDLKQIQGICFRENGKLFLTGFRDWIKNIDDIPLPSRDLLRINRHSYIFSSRGCPYRCTFCASSRYWDRVRLFSAEYVAREIKELVEKYDANFISFFDDLFIISEERIKKIVELLKKEKFYGKVKFSCSCRANLVNEKIAQLLKEMGVVSVGMGLESGCERILKYLKAGSVTVQNNINAVKILKKHGIAANASFVIGSPDETEREIMETYNFIKNNPLDLVDTYVLTPLPGTPVWEYAKQKNLVSDNMDWDRLNINFNQNYRNAIIVSEVLSREAMWNIYRKFQRQRFFRNLKNIWRHPYAQDVPKTALKLLLQKTRSFLPNLH